MPHIIVEYSKQLSDVLDVQGLLRTLHVSLANSGVDQERIKTRAIPLENTVVGFQEDKGQMIHLTLLLLEGRDVATKKSFGDPLHEILLNAVGADCAVTLEIRDMDPGNYYK